MITDADKAYFQERAETEIELAQRAQHPDAVRSHYLLAGFYLDLVHFDGITRAAMPESSAA